MIRRGGRADRTARVLPENIDGMVDELRESTKRTHGAQPIVSSKAWWRKTAGSNGTKKIDLSESGRGAPGWKATKREMVWNTLPLLNEQFHTLPTRGMGEVDVAPPSFEPG